nr:PREDICTED: 5'-AMP-activated protein kinase subunit gamma-2-like [Paralichthys olivaceus]
MSFLEGDPAGAGSEGGRKGEPLCHSTRSLLHRPSSSSSKTIFNQTGPQHDAPLRTPRRLSFSGIFRSASRDLNHQPLPPVTIKLFTRNKRDKARVSVDL